MVTIGYFLSSEEHPGSELVRAAAQSEQAGFDAAWISDHFHPWLDDQGQSPFVWSVLGAIAQATSTLRVTTAVTAPIIRIHPAILAQAAATTAELFGDVDGRSRFGFGVLSAPYVGSSVLACSRARRSPNTAAAPAEGRPGSIHTTVKRSAETSSTAGSGGPPSTRSQSS